jgi:hypothetical protein
MEIAVPRPNLCSWKRTQVAGDLDIAGCHYHHLLQRGDGVRCLLGEEANWPGREGVAVLLGHSEWMASGR